ncbi:hypothetical protein [Rhizobium sp. MHM7A]|uniref:hypothetical protein n=1 Tax=Rhizobium sp. MHM7A TaxID=2583233 RepID=UPI001106A74C|nr:hypothetical protein [Rhizobium sp. MHM7A]TLX16598.1 hypothetical protein FFR93_04460 [Rhizobium sp. MHM7A]
MPFYHATWRKHLPSIQKYGLGGAAPDRQNFPVEAGVYLANEPIVAISILLEAYIETGDELGLTPPEALAAMCVLVIDDSRVNVAMLDSDPNIERRDLTHLYRGIIDVTGLPVLSVDDIVPPDAMTDEEAKSVLGIE